MKLSYPEKCAYTAWKGAGKPDEWTMMEADSTTGHISGEVLGYPTPFEDWYVDVDDPFRRAALKQIPFWNLDIGKLYDICENVTLLRKNTSLNQQWLCMLEAVKNFPERISVFWLYLKTFGLIYEGEKKDAEKFLKLEKAPNDPPYFFRRNGIYATIVKDKLVNKYMRMMEFWDGSIANVYTHPKWKFHKGLVWIGVDDNAWDVGRYVSTGEYNTYGVRMK